MAVNISKGVQWAVAVFLMVCLQNSLAFMSLSDRVYMKARLLSSVVISTPKIQQLPDESPTTTSLILRNGYAVETHMVLTADGYILELHRIPYGRNGPTTQYGVPRYPVLLQHGNFQSSADWVINYPIKDALAFTLADAGYDVWLGNQRGNDYSYRHTEHRLSSNSFWNFTFHEIGVYDVTAMVDYVLFKTGAPKVNYIGFSMGTTAFFAALSKRPEYNEKINVGVMLGPTPFQRYFMHGFLRLVSSAVWLLEVVQNVIGTIPVLPQVLTNIMHRFFPIVCHPRVDILGVCLTFVNTAFGNDNGNIEKEKMPAITSVFPSPNSLKMFMHIMQLIATGRFAEYDYGPTANMRAYGMPYAPDYNLTNVQVPIAIIVGNNDIIGHPEDAKTLASRLPNVVDFHYVPNRYFTHLDFTYAKDAGSLVYDRVLAILNRFPVTF